MKRFIKFVATFILFVLCTVIGIKAVTEYMDAGYRMAAYVAINPETNIDTFNFDKVTNLYIAFAYIDEEHKITLANPLIEDVEKRNDTAEKISDKIKELREAFPDIKISIAVGGYMADGFSDMASDEKSREAFVDSVDEFIREYKLDGIDIDWEFPVSGGSGTIKSRPEDKQNFTYLMEDLRKVIDELIEEKNTKYELTFAQTPLDEGFENIELEKVEPLIDAMNLMTYDYTGAWSEVSAHNSNLYKYGDSEKQMNTDDAIKKYKDMGFDMRKIILGVPAYGYAWKGVTNNDNNGLQQSVKESLPHITYKEIKKKYLGEDGFVRYWDNDAKVPYLYNGDVFISYEDQDSAKIKASYIRENKLGGAMIWEYTQDDNNELINALTDILRRK